MAEFPRNQKKNKKKKGKANKGKAFGGKKATPFKKGNKAGKR